MTLGVGETRLSDIKKLRYVSTGVGDLARAVELVDGGNGALVGVGVKGIDSGESEVWAELFVVCIRSFCGVSTVVNRVALLLFGGDCGDSFSTSMTGVGVSCTILIECYCGWSKHDGFSTILIGVVVTVMVMLDIVSGCGFSTLLGWWVMI